jgi:hypothetical protein
VARKRKQVDLEEAIDDANQAERRKNSELTEDEKRVLLYQHRDHYKVALAAKKAADAELKNVCKKAKAECGKNAVADIKDLIALAEPGGDVGLRDEIERKLRLARWASVPVGHQFSFSEDMRPATDVAFEQGKIRGLEGGDMTPPYAPSLPQYQRWLEGWHAGQEILSSDFRKKLDTDPPPADLPNTADTSDPAFLPGADDQLRVPAE